MPWLALAVAAGLVSLFASSLMVVRPLTMLGSGMQREFLVADHGPWIGGSFLIAAVAYVACLVLFVLAAVRWSGFRRAHPGVRHPHAALRVIGWILVTAAPLITAVMGSVFVIVYITLGVMCGESVSLDC